MTDQKSDMPRVLITGASGFIGGHLVEEATRKGWRVYAGLRGSSDSTIVDQFGAEHFAFDMRNRDVLRQALQDAEDAFGGFDYVIHSAGVTKPKRTEDFYSGNAGFTEDFATMLRDTQPDLKKFVFISSIAATGPGDPVTFEPIDEDKPDEPITHYGRSKLAGEERLHAITGLKAVSLRPAAVYGPRDKKFVERITQYFKLGFDFRLGSAKQMLSFVHVKDLCAATLAACTNDVPIPAINIADGNRYPQSALNEAIIEALGARTITIRIPAPVLRGIGYTVNGIMSTLGKEVHLNQDKMREVTARNWLIDISNAQKYLDYNPSYGLRDGILETLGKRES